MVLETFCRESSESMRGEVEGKMVGREEVRSEIEMREFWRWRFDGQKKKRLTDPICRLIVG